MSPKNKRGGSNPPSPEPSLAGVARRLTCLFARLRRTLSPAQDGEHAVISGGQLLVPRWSPRGAATRGDGDVHAKPGDSGIWVTDIADPKVGRIDSLNLNGRRAIRAQYPNHVPELGFGSTLMANAWLKPTPATSNLTDVYPKLPFRELDLRLIHRPGACPPCAACLLGMRIEMQCAHRCAARDVTASHCLSLRPALFDQATTPRTCR